MQSLVQKRCSGCGVERVGGGRHFRVASEPKVNNSINIQPEETKSLSQIMKNDNGLIVVNGKNGIFYIRHDIIFAKAGDVFFMPRKVPADFRVEEEAVL